LQINVGSALADGPSDLSLLLRTIPDRTLPNQESLHGFEVDLFYFDVELKAEPATTLERSVESASHIEVHKNILRNNVSCYPLDLNCPLASR
jgi:hypothetical protein